MCVSMIMVKTMTCDQEVNEKNHRTKSATGAGNDHYDFASEGLSISQLIIRERSFRFPLLSSFLAAAASITPKFVQTQYKDTCLWVNC